MHAFQYLSRYLIAVALALPVAVAAAGHPFNQIAMTGDSAGTDDGAEIDNLVIEFGRGPAINVSNDVLFHAELRNGAGGFAVNDDNRSALFGPTAGAGSSLGLFVREGDTIDTPAGAVVFDSIFSGSLNDGGDIAFTSILRTSPAPGGALVIDSNNTAVFGPSNGAGSPLGLLVREDDLSTAGGAGGGARLSNPTFSTVNNQGAISFAAFLVDGINEDPIIPNVNDVALFGPVIGTDSLPRLIAQRDAPAETDDGADFGFFSIPTQNNNGVVAFRGDLRTGLGGEEVTPNNNQAFFTLAPNPGALPELIVRKGDAAGTDDGAVIGPLFSFDFPSINDAGQFAFRAKLRTGPGGEPVLPGESNALFGPTDVEGELFELIVRAGDSAGTDDGAEFEAIREPALNAAGDLAFEALLRTGDFGDAVTADNDRALFSHTGGVLELIVREGDLFDVEFDGMIEQRTIEEIRFNPLEGLSDSGSVAFALQFTDGTSGVFTTAASVPEPATLCLVGMFAITGIAVRLCRSRR